MRKASVREQLGAASVCLAALAAESAGAQTIAADHPEPDGGKDVVVTGMRALLGDKIPLSVRDTPQTVSVIPQRVLEDQGATRLEDALKNVPGVTLNAGEGAARGDTINIRGFSAFNDFFLDGIRDAAVYNRDAFDVSSVEVLKGPSATLFGRGSTGGVVNQVTKAPALSPSGEVIADVGSNDEYRATLDVDRPIGETAAWRLNAMGESSQVADRDDVKNRRWGLAPSASFGLGQNTTATIAFMHLQENDTPDSGVPFLNGEPAPAPRAAFYGLTSDHADSRVDIGTVVTRHEFDRTLSVTNTLRFAEYAFNYQFEAPNFGSTVPTAATPLASIRVGRDSPSSSGVQTNLTDQVDLTARFTTGAVTHTLVAEIELSGQTNDIDRFVNPFNSNNNWIPETPLLAPNPNQARPNEPVSSVQDTRADSEAAVLTDTMAIGRQFDLIVGARVDRFAAAYGQRSLLTNAVLDLNHTDVVGSPRLALVYKPTSNASLYLSYGTSFDPSAEALSLTTKTANLGPVKATTVEGGAKVGLLDGQLLATAAVFHTEVDNAQTNDPDNPTLTILNGDQRVQGVELGLSGHLTPKLEVIAGYSYLDGKTIHSGTAPYVGREMPNLAPNTANLWAEYHVTQRFESGLGVNYLDHRFADSGETANIPSFVVWNAMAGFKVTDALKLQVNALNLFDTRYYTGAYFTSPAENHVIPGAGRTIKLTAKARF